MRITRKLEFDAGHRVLNHEGKCRHLHGHRYVAEITVSAASLDTLGRVIDFSALKTLVGGWIDQELDHNMILHPEDPLINSQTKESAFDSLAIGKTLIGRCPFIMPAGYENPTAENISAVIGMKSQVILTGSGLTVQRVRLYETPNCWADWTPDNSDFDGEELQ